MTLFEIINNKRNEVVISRDDFITEEDDPGWMTRHPLGPVHTRLVCKCCGEVMKSDLKEYGHLESDSYWQSVLLPHLMKHT